MCVLCGCDRTFKKLIVGTLTQWEESVGMGSQESSNQWEEPVEMLQMHVKLT